MENPIDTWVENHQDDLLAFLTRLVQTPSEVRPPHGGELACQRLVEAAFRNAGAVVDTFTPDEVPGLRQHPAFCGTWDGMPRPFNNRPDVVGLFRGQGGGRSILFSTHIDTVPRDPLPWKESQPFSGEIKDGKLYGRGSWDTKWGVAAGLYAVRCLHELGIPLRGDVILESVVDEEFGGSHGVLAARLRGYNADIAINSEPTGMLATPAHHGGGEWRITVHGDSGMNYEDRPKTNAVYRLACLIEALHAYEIERNRHPHPPRFYEDSPFLPVVIRQVGGGGDSYGEVTGVPAECYLIVWVEEYPGASQADHTHSLTCFINDFIARQPGFDGLLPEFNPLIRYLPGSSMDPRHPFFDVLRDAFEQTGQPFQVTGAPLACDTYIFNLYSPTPALTLGPRGANAHASDEFVLLEDVIRLTRIYARAIAEWCK